MLIPATSWEQDRKRSFQKNYVPFQKAVEKGNKKGYDFDDFSQDLYSSLYQVNPKFPESSTPGTSWAKKALDELQSLPEFKQARESGTKCNSFQSGLGASILTKHFAENLPKAPEQKNPDQLQRQIENIEKFLEEFDEKQIKNNDRLSEYNDRLDQLRNEHTESIQAWEEATGEIDSSKIRQVLRKGLSEAKHETSKLEESCNAFGFGSEPGIDGYADPSVKLAVAEKIKKNQKLQQIANLAGRFRIEARKEQANKTKPGPDELVDVEIGNELGKLLPTELMKLNDPDTELTFFKSYFERGLLQYKTEVVEKEHKGPIVFCIDNSGSMQGAPEIWSKALLLAILQIALDTERNCEVIHFNSRVKRRDVFNYNKIDPNSVIETCSYFSGGGTDIAEALIEAVNDIEKGGTFKKADIILISDGISPLPAICQQTIQTSKKESGLRLHTIMLGPKSHYEKALEKLSDFYVRLSDFREDAEIKKQLFSI